MAGKISVSRLKEHSKNNYYFTDIDGEKYEEIKRSIETNGIRDPLKVTTSYTVVSGHQRLRIAKSLGLTEVPVEILDVDEWQAEYLLIAENVERRGQAETDPIKKSRIAKFLDEYWKHKREEIRQNGGKKKTVEDIAEFIGEPKRNTERLIKLNELIPQLQKLVSSGKLGTTAAEQLAYLSTEVQTALYDALGEEIGQRTVEEVRQLRKDSEGKSADEVKRQLDEERARGKQLEEENAKLRDDLSKAKTSHIIEKEVVKEVVPDDIATKIGELKRKLIEAKRESTELQSSLADTYEELQQHKKRERTSKMQYESPLYDVFRSLTATNGYLNAVIETGDFLDRVVDEADSTLRDRLGAEVKQAMNNLRELEGAINKKNAVIDVLID